jgi:uncharacterized protein YkwD
MLMARTDYYAHVGPDGSAPWDRARSQGYQWQSMGENIAAGQRSIADVMAAWIDSPSHLATLLDPTLRHVGFGHASAASSTYGDYWVQDFGRGRGC